MPRSQRQRGQQQQLRRLLWSLVLALLALVVACLAAPASSRAPTAGFLQPKAKAKAEAPPSSCSSSTSGCHRHQHRHQHQQARSCQQPLRASTTTNSGGSGGSAEPTRTCRNCKQQYRASENGDRACRYHRGIFTGRLARIDDADPSGDKDWFWSCCGEEAKDGPGCTAGPHQSYDDPPGPWTSGFQ